MRRSHRGRLPSTDAAITDALARVEAGATDLPVGYFLGMCGDQPRMGDRPRIRRCRQFCPTIARVGARRST
jgi:hypothetical protein